MTQDILPPEWISKVQKEAHEFAITLRKNFDYGMGKSISDHAPDKTPEHGAHISGIFMSTLLGGTIWQFVKLGHEGKDVPMSFDEFTEGEFIEAAKAVFKRFRDRAETEVKK